MTDISQKLKDAEEDAKDGAIKKLEACETQRDEYLAGWQRAKADFVNYKKEEAARLQEIMKYATEDLMRSLIGVLDSFDLGLSALEKQGPMEKGMYMIRAQLEDALTRNGLEIIKASPGDEFNPALHNAVASVPSKYGEGAIVEEVEAGYMLYGKIIRAVQVKVSKGIGGIVKDEEQKEG